MKKIRITVIKTSFNSELVKEYGAPGLTPCPLLHEGQTFLVDFEMPKGFCPAAWKSIYSCVFELMHGSTDSQVMQIKYLDWMNRNGLAICCCHDGLRPTYFKIEATDIPSDYVAVSGAGVLGDNRPETSKDEVPPCIFQHT